MVNKRITRDRGHKGKGRVDRRREDKIGGIDGEETGQAMALLT